VRTVPREKHSEYVGPSLFTPRVGFHPWKLV
jgi:hypothetical protein